jgi:predicted RND superfamily exporter protein
MWHKFSTLIFRYRVLGLILIALVTLFMGIQSRKVEMSYQMAEILPRTDKTYSDYQYFRKIFGEEANVLVLAVQDSAFFTSSHLNSWVELEQKVKSLEHIEWVLSPSSAMTLSKNEDSSRFEMNKLVNSNFINDSIVSGIENKVAALKFYDGILWNAQTGTYIMLAGLNKKVVHSKERIAVIENFKQTVAEFENKSGLNVRVSGLPFLRTDSIVRASKEITIFVILAAAITSIVMFLFFRSLSVLLVALINVAICIVWSSGTMALLGYKITILTGLLPPLLIVIGIPNAVYMITRYQVEFLKVGNRIRALHKVIEKTGKAIFLTNLTTAVGFGTMIITNSKTMVEFGTVSFINIISLFVLSIILIPILLSYLPPPSIRQTRHLKGKRSGLFLNFIENVVKTHRVKVYVVAFVLLIFAVFGILKIKTSGRVADDVPKNSKAFTDLSFFEKEFNGVMPFEILIDSKKEKGASFLKTKLWKRVNELQDSLHAMEIFSRPVSAIDLVKYANQVYYNGDAEEYRIPNEMDMGRIAKYTSGVSKGDSLMYSYVDSNQRYIRIRAQMMDMGTYEMKSVTKRVEEITNQVFTDMDVDVIYTGASIMIMKGTDYLVKNLISSLLLAIFLIAVIMGFMFRSFKMVLISMLPNMLPLLFTAGIMGYMGIPLKASTSIIFSVAFGISVDDTIHFLAKYRQELKRWQGDVKKAIETSVQETGLSMTYTSIILFFGFSIFIASDFGGTVALGILVSITLLLAMFTNLFMLPSLVLSLNKKKITAKELEEIEEDNL